MNNVFKLALSYVQGTDENRERYDIDGVTEKEGKNVMGKSCGRVTRLKIQINSHTLNVLVYRSLQRQFESEASNFNIKELEIIE